MAKKKPTVAAVPEPAPAHASNPLFNQWASGLSEAKRYEWLVDCYRMRVDDDLIWDNYSHGIVDGNATSFSVVLDFLLFCIAATLRGVLPSDIWNWKEFLNVARPLLLCGFSKDDAQEKYGSENIFAGVMGGRSLRFTGNMVYDGEMNQEFGPGDAVTQTLRESILWKFKKPEDFSRHAELLNDVGGIEIWNHLISNI